MSISTLLPQLSKLLGSSGIETNVAERIASSRTPFSYITDHTLPFAVAYPQFPGQIPQILKFCADNGISVRIRGNGSSFFPLSAPDNRDWLLIRTANLTKIIDFSPETRLLRIQCGVMVREIQNLLAEHNLWLPSLPACPDSTAGGALAENAAQANYAKYGALSSYLTELQAGLVSGKSLFFTNAAGAPSHGFPQLPFAQIFCGSRGMLGAILEVTFKLLPKPEEEKIFIGQGSLKTLFQLIIFLKNSFPLPSSAMIIDPGMAKSSGLNQQATLIMVFNDSSCQLSKNMTALLELSKNFDLTCSISETLQEISPEASFAEQYSRGAFSSIGRFSCQTENFISLWNAIEIICKGCNLDYRYIIFPYISSAEILFSAKDEAQLNTAEQELTSAQLAASDTPDLDIEIGTGRVSFSENNTDFNKKLASFFDPPGILHNF